MKTAKVRMKAPFETGTVFTGDPVVDFHCEVEEQYVQELTRSPHLFTVVVEEEEPEQAQKKKKKE